MINPTDANKDSCSFERFDWSLDANRNIIEVTPVKRTNGFTGNIQRVLERAR